MPRTARSAVASAGSVAGVHRQDAIQVIQNESLGKLTEHALAKVVLHTRFLEFAAEERLVVSGVRHAFRLRHKRDRRRERDAMLRAEDACAEGDGGNVPFARSPQAQNETERALGNPVWSGGVRWKD